MKFLKYLVVKKSTVRTYTKETIKIICQAQYLHMYVVRIC